MLQHLSAKEIEGLRVIAPAGFEEEATSENLIVGPAMSRRALFMYGKRLERGPLGHVDTGLGKEPAFGTFGFTSPTDIIYKTGEELTIDGTRLIFQIVSASEAPAEFTFYLPEQKVFCGAELVSHNLHNVYSLRGAKVRDARLWSDYIKEASIMFAEADTYFASHHWPIWGQAKIQEFLAKQSDTYKFLHDQSVRLLNRGATPNEISEKLALPKELMEDFHNQNLYGTLSHNAKAIYQYYMGWFSANPSQLNPLPETEASQRYIEMMGGAERVLEKALSDYSAAGNMDPVEGKKTYRWLAELLNHLVFAEPKNRNAKELLAHVYQQLGYQEESGPWRDFYLTAALELRQGAPKEGINSALMKEILLSAPVALLFDSMAVSLDASKAAGRLIEIKVVFTDLDESYLLTLSRSVLRHRIVDADTPADATLSITHPMFIDLIVQEAGLKELLFSSDIKFDGSKSSLLRFFTMLDKPEGKFPIVTP